MKLDEMIRKLKKAYIKFLSGYARQKLAKAYELEDRAIMLELELEDQRKLVEEIDEGFDALKDKNK